MAENKGIALEKTEVDIRLIVNEGRPSSASYEIEIDLGPGLDKRERTILFNSAKSCDVHKILVGEAVFDYKLVA